MSAVTRPTQWSDRSTTVSMTASKAGDRGSVATAQSAPPAAARCRRSTFESRS